MVSDKDIRRTARAYIEQFCDDAPITAAMGPIQYPPKAISMGSAATEETRVGVMLGREGRTRR